MQIEHLHSGEMLTGKDIDATANRERMRQRRLKRSLFLLIPVFAWLV